MSEPKRLERAFLDALVALGPELPRLVIVGGWCPYLYATCLWKKKIPNIPTTMDVDLGVAETGPQKFETTVYDRLKQMGLAVQVPRPETFLFHKGITFVNRSDSIKRDKDLFYVYFILRFSPDPPALLEAISNLKSHDYFGAFRQNLADHLSDPSCPGYLMLRPFVSRWVEERAVNREIEETFRALLRGIGPV